VEFRVLGPVRVLDGDRIVPVAAGRVRALLAVLLLRANKVVTVQELTEHVWDDPPGNPRAAIQTYVLRLRQALGDGVVHTDHRGYRIELDPEQLDLTRFRLLVDRAARATGPAERAGLLGRALALWQGQPLVDVPAEAFARTVLPGLAEERLHALEQWTAARLEIGEHGDVIAELTTLATDHPLRERFWAQLMLALYRAGRQADALEAYRTISRRLADELGIDPGAELRELHQSLLTGSAALPPKEPRQPDRPVPRQLPPDVRGFVGRLDALARLDALPTAGATVITGTAGVGKSALAAHWARRVADRFPDGQLWLNLRGYDPEQPMDPEQALTILLRALGVPGPEIPLGSEAKTGLYRSLLADRRVLVVLDNVGGPEQARPLLPGAPGCLTLITSRDELSGLVARDGATRVRLDLLSGDEAVALLRDLLGAERAGTTPQTLARLADLCARLPLALRIAADRLDARGGPLDAEVDELAGEQRLDTFAAGNDSYTAARSVFSWSFRALPAAAAELFRRLGLVPGQTWDAYAAAALADRPLAETRGLLDVLTSAHLVEARAGRYQMHDLLRAYAVEHARAEDGDAGCHAAQTRLFDSYLHTAATAMDVAFPYERHRRPRIAAPSTPSVPIRDLDAAMAWLDTERQNLVAIAVHVADQGWPTHTVRLAATLYRYLLTGAHHSDALTVHQRALHAATMVGDRGGEATALHNLAIVFWQTGTYDRAVDCADRALVIRRDIGDRTGEAATLNNLGTIMWQLGRYHQSAERYQEALTAFRAVGDRTGEATALNNLGIVFFRWGHHDQAFDRYEQALAIRREIDDRTGEASALNSLGLVYLRWGHFKQAADHCGQALGVAREIGARSGEADPLNSLGLVHTQWGRHEEAFAYYDQALAIGRELGDREIEATTLNGLGETSAATGQHDRALAHHRTALELSREIGARYEEARALNGLAHAHRHFGDDDTARRQWQEAAELYAELGVPESDEVRASLDQLGETATPDR
jgi:DNA-binding SARP family transcriptional activator/Tfp pilus assembly protein PilF